MYCQDCHEEAIRERANPTGKPLMAFIFDPMNADEIANHMLHRFVSLMKFKEDKLPEMLSAPDQSAALALRDLLRVALYVRGLYDQLKTEMDRVKELKGRVETEKSVDVRVVQGLVEGITTRLPTLAATAQEATKALIEAIGEEKLPQVDPDAIMPQYAEEERKELIMAKTPSMLTPMDMTENGLSLFERFEQQNAAAKLAEDDDPWRLPRPRA